jgi:hypothetical protein
MKLSIENNLYIGKKIKKLILYNIIYILFLIIFFNFFITDKKRKVFIEIKKKSRIKIIWMNKLNIIILTDNN